MLVTTHDIFLVTLNLENYYFFKYRGQFIFHFVTKVLSSNQDLS